MLWIILVIVLFIYIAIKAYNNVNYWASKGIAHVKPWPLLGSFGESLLRKLSMADQLQKLYYKHPEAKFVGVHQLTRPTLMIRDPEVIKQITVKSFDSFIDHTVIFTEDIDPLFGKNLLSLKGQRWKEMRATLSPAFTSSKMKKMYTLIKDCAEQFTQHFLQKEKEKGTLQLEMRDIFTKYTNDVIATSAFGITCNSLNDVKNEFYVIGNKIINGIKFFAFIMMPRVMKALKFGLLSKGVTDFFLNIIKTTIEVREKNNIIRPDMIHLLMEARKGQLKHELEKDEDAGFATVEESELGKEVKAAKQVLTDEDITAQALLFFMAGYHTSSTMMCFLAHELAINSDVQNKLQDEIDAAMEKCNSNLDYNTLLQMKYLDMVISEGLRKWPPAPLTERICNNAYTLVDGDQSLTLEKEQSVWMPVYCLHHDEKYFENPEKFDPERFNDENKHNIVPFSYLPFGAGPRNCIGSRFALLEIKTLFVNILAKFDIVPIEKTQIPLKLSKNPFAMKAENGFWLGFKHRV